MILAHTASFFYTICDYIRRGLREIISPLHTDTLWTKKMNLANSLQDFSQFGVETKGLSWMEAYQVKFDELEAMYTAMPKASLKMHLKTHKLGTQEGSHNELLQRLLADVRAEILPYTCAQGRPDAERETDWAEAGRLLKEVVAEQTEQLGPVHIDTLTTKMNLANLLRKICGHHHRFQPGRNARTERSEATRLIEEVIAGFTEQLGSTHRRTQEAQRVLRWLGLDSSYVTRTNVGLPHGAPLVELEAAEHAKVKPLLYLAARTVIQRHCEALERFDVRRWFDLRYGGRRRRWRRAPRAGSAPTPPTRSKQQRSRQAQRWRRRCSVSHALNVGASNVDVKWSPPQ
jgi:hypothetical protein